MLGCTSIHPWRGRPVWQAWQHNLPDLQLASQLAEVGPSAVTVALPSRVASLMMVLYMSGATGGSVDHEFVVLTIAREVAKATVATGGAAAAGGAWLPVMALARLATTARKRVIFLVEGVDWLCRASLS
eukprot:CCRYP_006286-RA/>CCRYP_006286-RA protein AED:0.38 eAED:0.38 QI:0/0.33/0.25/1/0.66/0.5/4/123/128